MSYADPTLVKAAIDAGSYSGGLISGQSCVLTAGVWDVTNGEGGDTIGRAAFNLIKAGSVNPNFTINTQAGTFQLVSQDGHANLIDP
jgi:hypothetical protein